MKKVNKRYSKVILVILLLMGFIVIPMRPVQATEYSGPFTRVKEVSYPSWMGHYSTWMCTFNGKYSYCLEASKNTPTAANKTASEIINNNELLRKCLYYGFGGPGDVLSGMLDYDNSDGVLFTADDAYVATHIVASYIYSGDLHGCDVNATFGKETVFKWFYEYIQNAVNPFSPYLESKLVAYYDQDSGKQKTNTTKFIAASDSAKINIPLQEGVTLHNVTQNTTGSGTVTINGNDSFYLMSDKFNNPNFTSNNISGDNCTRYTALALMGGDNEQTHGSFAVDPANVTYSVEWLDTGSLELRKIDDVGEFIDGAVFNLSSTSYQGFSKDYEVKNGKIKIDNIPIGTYILSEKKVPDGYVATQKIFEVTIIKDETTDKVVVNNLRPTGRIEINKELELKSDGVSCAIDASERSGIGVQFRLSALEDIYDRVTLEKIYSKGDYINADGMINEYDQVIGVTSSSPSEDGYYVTDEEGKLIIAGLPMGKYKLEETKTLDGYVTSGSQEIIFKQEDFKTKEYLKIIDIENSLTKVSISKQDITTHKELPGANLQIIDDQGNIIDEWISINQPHLIEGLKTGNQYTLKETLAPEGYNVSSDITFTVDNTGTVQQVTMYDEIIKSIQTGDGNDELGYLIIGVIALCTLVVIGKKYLQLLS